MYSSRPVQLLLVAISIICIVQAAWWDMHRFDSRNSRTLTLARRQDPKSPDPTTTPPKETGGKETGTASDNSSDSSTKPPDTTPPSSSSTPSSTPPPSTSDSSSSEKTSDPTSPSQSTSAPSSSSTPPPESSSSSTTDQSSSTTSPPQQNTNNENTTPTSGPHVSTQVEVFTRTNKDGSKTTQSTTSIITPTPGADKDSSGSTGMSTNTRNTIIGAVVGVGGAILIGALAIVAFRIWGRKKQAEESAALMDYNIGSNGAEKAEQPTSSGSGQERNPFQSTLENYHQPTAPVNASSNF